MEPIHLSLREYFLYIAIIGAAVGAVFGIVPLLLGIRRGRRRLGIIGFAASIIGGAIAPLLSIVVVAIFIWLIVKKNPPAGDDGASPGVDDGPPAV